MLVVGVTPSTTINKITNKKRVSQGSHSLTTFGPLSEAWEKLMVTLSSWCHSYLVVCVKVKLINMYSLISQMVALNIIMNRFIDHSCLTFKNSSSSSLLDMVFKEKQITLIAFFKIVIEIVLVEGVMRY